jgi:WD40 repeat protein
LFVKTPNIAVSSIAFHPIPSMPYFAVGCGDGIAKLCRYSNTNPEVDRCVATLNGHAPENGVHSVAFNYDGSLLATASGDKTVKLWKFQGQIENPTCVATLVHSACVHCVAFHPNGHILASGSEDNTVKLWRISPGNDSAECVTTLHEHTDSVSSIAFHQNGQYLATGSNDKTVRLWQFSLEQLESEPRWLATLAEHTEWVKSVAFHPRELLLATGSYDYTAKLFRFSRESPPDVHCVATLTGHSLQVYSVAFHPTLPYLATGSGDKTAKLWNFSNESAVNCAATLTGHTSGVLAVAFNTNGMRTLATASRDGTVKLWQVSDILGWGRSFQQLMFGREFGCLGASPKHLQPKDKYGIPDAFKGVGARKKGGASKKKKRSMIKNGVRCSRRRRNCRSRKQQGRLKTPH